MPQMLDVAAFDSVSVRFGYMYRVFKPGGRLCSSVWGQAEDKPWTAATAPDTQLPGGETVTT
ncbi:hypothetical protein [Actinomadura rugatobispora]|uniref:Uncharacterized protein n=1 Tax=Actinomadura rugatobispora TaxID=1994 RepID=A0ABW0ZQ40_9ACTN